MEDMASRMAKGGRGAGIGAGALAALGAAAVGLYQSIYTGKETISSGVVGGGSSSGVVALGRAKKKMILERTTYLVQLFCHVLNGRLHLLSNFHKRSHKSRVDKRDIRR